MRKINKLRDFWRGADLYEGVAPNDGPVLSFKQDMGPLKRALEEAKPRRILEIGTHGGASAIFMAENSDAEILCIDPWSLKHDCVFHDFRRWGRAYDLFRGSVIARGLQDRITFLPMTSAQAFYLFREQCENLWFDMAYVDGDHEKIEAEADILRALEVAPYVVVDDCNKAFPGVQDAVRTACCVGRAALVRNDGYKAILKRNEEWQRLSA